MACRAALAEIDWAGNLDPTTWALTAWHSLSCLLICLPCSQVSSSGTAVDAGTATGAGAATDAITGVGASAGPPNAGPGPPASSKPLPKLGAVASPQLLARLVHPGEL